MNSENPSREMGFSLTHGWFSLLEGGLCAEWGAFCADLWPRACARGWACPQVATPSLLHCLHLPPHSAPLTLLSPGRRGLISWGREAGSPRHGLQAGTVRPDE